MDDRAAKVLQELPSVVQKAAASYATATVFAAALQIGDASTPYQTRVERAKKAAEAFKETLDT